jgi:hypothetical protein
MFETKKREWKLITAIYCKPSKAEGHVNCTTLVLKSEGAKS